MSRLNIHLIGVTITIACCASVVVAQSNDNLSAPKIRRALEYLQTTEPDTIKDQIKVCEIPAPPFQEGKRAEYFKQRFSQLGLKNVRIDGIGNVIGERPGAGDGPTLVLAAHLDTVFPEGTEVKVKQNGPILYGPGIGDDCRGLGVILAVARALDE